MKFLPYTKATLGPALSSADEVAIKASIKPYPTDALLTHPLRPLLGKSGSGNVPEASDAYEYPELLRRIRWREGKGSCSTQPLVVLH